MNGDQQTYRRAANASLVGLALQVILCLSMALIGMWSESAPITSVAAHLFGGCFIWFILFLIYNQHRIERVEALEAEQLTKRDQVAAAMFEEHADDLDLARRRLDRLYKWGLGIASFIAAGYLLIVGAIRFYNAYVPVKGAETFAESDLFGMVLGANAEATWLMVMIAPVAFIAFIGARYVAGMTGVKEWQLLRGGASYLMGSFVISLLIFIAVLMEVTMDSRTFLAVNALLVPGLMMLIGVEILLTFLLSAYRPRKAGEVARPAFDSRVLGLMTSPKSLASIINEAINYQFGFEISSSWFYQLLSKSVTPLTIIGMALLFAVSSIVIVGPHEQAVVTNFGHVSKIVDSGLHMKRPWPFAKATKYEVGRVHTIAVGSTKSKTDPNVAILWTNSHAEGEEDYMVTLPPKTITSTESITTKGGTPGISLLAAEVHVQYRINDLRRYINVATNPTEVLTNISDSVANRYFATHSQDELLAAGRDTAGEELKGLIQGEIDNFYVDGDSKGLGLEVTFVGFVGVHPPQQEEGEVAKAFHTQIGAIQERETLIHKARRESNSMLAEVAGSAEQAQAINDAILELEALKSSKADARKIVEAEAKIDQMLSEAYGEAATKIFEARAYRWQRAVTEQAKAEKFVAESLAYDKAPQYYRERHYLDAISIGLQDARKIIRTTKSKSEPIIRIDLKDDRTGLETILSPN